MLTPDRARRAVRALAAAHAKLMAGSPEAARQLAAAAERGPLTPLDGARVELLRAQTALYPIYRPEAPRLLVHAARRLAPLDAALSRETHLAAIEAAIYAGPLGEDGELYGAARAGLAAPPAPEPPCAVDLLLDGLATQLVEGGASGFAVLKQALVALRVEPDVRRLWMAMISAMDLGDDGTWEVLVSRQVQIARETGAIATLPVALTLRAILLTFGARFNDAAAVIQEADDIGSAIGAAPHPAAPLILTAWQGRPDETTALIASARRKVTNSGEGLIITTAEYAEAIQRIGLGQYDAALEAALKASANTEPFSSLPLPDVVEAALRSNKPDIARAAVQRLSTVARASGTQWALGIEARSQALVCEDRLEAETLYVEAIERLRGTAIAVDLARAHLLFGEWLRRERRRTDAREHLRTAHDMFSAMGAEAFADRAARELRVTGERARKRSTGPIFQLTPQQAQVARLASQGRSNPEIAAQLFISPRTVEYHLRGVFAVLGITSRKQLANALD
jgi:DNA-binding CsgD family transcriptional regulator